MTDRGSKFGKSSEELIGAFSQGSTGLDCEACEAMCLDAVDGTLTAAELTVFDRHVAGCVSCAEQVAEARRGAAWMEMLKGHRPEPPAGMLQRILAQTSEAEMSRVFPRHGIVPTPEFRNVVPARGKREALWDRIEATFTFDGGTAHFQPRMAMTAAMAFFSIALTMNLGGVRLADLKPGAIQRSLADAKASAARSIQSMKVVYQVESRVNELRDDDRDPGGPFVDSEGGKKAPAAKAAPQGEKPAQLPNAQPQNAQPKDDDGSKDKAVPTGTSEVVPNVEREIAPDADPFAMQRGA